ncbi:peptidoglycan-associated lipoprotein Pal [bacterium]|nr:peptidoglycan-associated lipoprotein Pal [bacterium]
MRNPVCLGCGILALFVLFILFPMTGVVDDRVENHDLAEMNHPELFKWQWGAAETTPIPTITAKKPSPTPTPKEEKPTIPERDKGKPIPFDELDNSLIQRVHFDYDKSAIKPKAQKGIEINSEWLKNHPEYDILLEGHCDERGSNEYNLALGERRAAAVKDVMVELGIDKDRITTRSWGEEKPLSPKRSEKAYALNRRVEFYAIPK